MLSLPLATFRIATTYRLSFVSDNYVAESCFHQWLLCLRWIHAGITSVQDSVK